MTDKEIYESGKYTWFDFNWDNELHVKAYNFLKLIPLDKRADFITDCIIKNCDYEIDSGELKEARIKEIIREELAKEKSSKKEKVDVANFLQIKDG